MDSIASILTERVGPDNRFPPSFDLEKELGMDLPQETPRFAPGAWDGVLLFHFGEPDTSDEEAEDLLKLMEADSPDVQKIQQIVEKKRAVFLRMPIHRVLANRAGQQANNLYNFAHEQLLTTRSQEMLKISLVLLSQIEAETMPAGLKEVILCMGLWEEFTFFAGMCMRFWPNGQQMLMHLARACDGWGRIHALLLMPSFGVFADEIYLSLSDNRVDSNYTALTIFENAKVMDRFREGPKAMDRDGFLAFSRLIAALLRGEPVHSFDELDIEDIDDIAMIYPSRVAQWAERAEDYDALMDLCAFLQEKDFYRSLAEQSLEVLHSEQCRQHAMQAVEDGRTFRLAEYLGIPCQQAALALLAQGDGTDTTLINALLSEDYLPKLLDVLREKWPLEHLQGAPEQSLSLSGKDRKHFLLVYLVDKLQHTPCQGEDFVAAALNSPHLDTRNVARRVLRGWRKQTGKPLAVFSPSCVAALNRLLKQSLSTEERTDSEQLLFDVLPEETDIIKRPEE